MVRKGRRRWRLRRLCTMYDVRCTIEKFARVARGFGKARADEMSWRCDRGWFERGGGGYAAYVRCMMYDVRFINNVRVAQILFGSLTYAEILLNPSLR